ncbi:MAG: hypothetical protein KIA08_11885 [Clostridium baratii]|uniref:hypothetical protein n=1 Tax=Clostridium baratii TaxID=1561 RepID=UPI0024311762|nr:hypothetical protein [Clostridium baratii]MBS6043380.1 hypothetical protein [Clostridium baratii]
MTIKNVIKIESSLNIIPSNPRSIILKSIGYNNTISKIEFIESYEAKNLNYVEENLKFILNIKRFPLNLLFILIYNKFDLHVYKIVLSKSI